MAAIGEERELRLHWQHVRELMLEEADVAALTWRLQLAVLKDAKLDVTALSEPIERMMNKPPPGLLSDAKLNVMEEDQQPTELTESSERSDSDSNSNSKEECGPAKNSSRPRPDLYPRRRSKQKAVGDPTATARRSVAQRKNRSRPRPDLYPRRSGAEKKNPSRPKLAG